MIIKKYKINGMHCTSCAMDIDGELEDNGAIEARTSYAKAVTEVKFDPENIKEERIISIINNLGYNAEAI